MHGRTLLAFLAGLLLALPGVSDAQNFIVENGRPRATIIVAEDPPRMVRLAAEELRDCVLKITGAELPIATAPTDDHPVSVLVGRSARTDALGLSDEELEHGAFRIVTGDDYLALLGRDYDYEPKEPYPRTNADIQRAHQEWEEIAGGTWRNPLATYAGPARGFNRSLGLWKHDQGGSLNAVHEWLRSLGVRWYMPGELGEVTPTMQSIPLPQTDKTVHPDYPLRYLHWYNFSAYSAEDILWAYRLGLNTDYDLLGDGMTVHGMRIVHGHPEMRRNHPEYYALYGQERDTEFRGSGHACFSSPGLTAEAVSFGRALFDHFDRPAFDLMPQDGYRHCGCEHCRDQHPSDVVWNFVERVARELYKTHPDRLVTSGAYSAYVEPPESIERFSPNVAVILVSPRPGLDDPDRWEAHWDRVQRWLEKLPSGKIIRWANNRWSLGGNPLIHTRSFAAELSALKGKSLGDWNEAGRTGAEAWVNPGMSHINYYVQSRFLWNADQDLDELLEEYYRLFYGPARDEMKAAFDFAEASYGRRGRLALGLEDRLRFVELLHAAREAAEDTVYGQRVQLIMDELPPLEELRREVAQREAAGDPREDAPVVVARDMARPGAPEAYPLVNIRTGEEPDVETTLTVVWDEDALVFDIRCHEPDMENLVVTPDVWGGDSVAILLETPYHAYYQIEVNPEGRVFDADREDGVQQRWESMIEVETEQGEDYWRVVARIPVMPVDMGATDPYHYVVGDKPTRDDPWHFNVGRARMRDWEHVWYGFSPTGGGYHFPDKFAKLVVE